MCNLSFQCLCVSAAALLSVRGGACGGHLGVGRALRLYQTETVLGSVLVLKVTPSFGGLMTFPCLGLLSEFGCTDKA